MAVVIAVDSFKGSIRAAAAAREIAEGWRTVDPATQIRLLPMADGGEGTLDAFAAGVSDARPMPVRVTGPAGTPVAAAWLLLPRVGHAESDAPRGTAVVELAATSGIELLGGSLRPDDASTLGFGQAIAAALDHGVSRLVAGIGSSASTDGGAGVLRALGAELTDAAGRPIADGLRGLEDLARIDLTALRPLPPGGATVLTDVAHPLLGPGGAAAVFGPQKGLDRSGVVRADAALARWASLLAEAMAHAPGRRTRARLTPDVPGDGAAGGAGFALRAWGARLVPGAGVVADLVGLRDAVATASVVVTGEGSFDAQSAAGKAPAHVLSVAREAGAPVALVAGRIASDAPAGSFDAAISLAALAASAGEDDPARAAMTSPVRWLREAGAELARRFR